MNKLKVCFIGIGSIAKRHIKNLNELCEEKKIRLQIDALRSSRRSLEEDIRDYITKEYYSYSELPSDYDVFFITNPTEFHIESLSAVHEKARDFFIEKPITSYEKLRSVLDIPYRNDSLYYVACPLRYTNVIRYMKNHLDITDVLAVRCISSSYLPDWRPGTDYRNTYSAHKNLGGGVGIDLIHEWDYIHYLFNNPEKIISIYGKKSNLEIDSDDFALYIAEYPHMTVELHLDYYGRKALREMMVFTNHETIRADLISNRIEYLVSGKVIDLSEERNDFYKKEMLQFLECLDSRAKSNNSVEDAYHILNLTRGEIE